MSQPDPLKLVDFHQQVHSDVRRWRIRRGLTQEELALCLETATRQVQRIEREWQNMSLSSVFTIAQALGTAAALV